MRVPSGQLDNDWLRLAWSANFLEPVNTDLRVAYSRNEKVHVIVPAPQFMAALMSGGIVRRLRVKGEDNKGPIFEGVNEVLPPLTEVEAVEFIAWRDKPSMVNHWEVLNKKDVPARTFRNAWELE